MASSPAWLDDHRPCEEDPVSALARGENGTVRFVAQLGFELPNLSAGQGLHVAGELASATEGDRDVRTSSSAARVPIVELGERVMGTQYLPDFTTAEELG